MKTQIAVKGKLYGIGVGPGDPELLTIKAVNALHIADVIAVPESKSEAGSVALDIARPYLKPQVTVLPLTFPMTKDIVVREQSRKQNALQLLELLKQGKNVAFVTLGDPMLYSTYVYLLKHLEPEDITMESIPGIYSFSALSNILNMPLVAGNESLAVICSENSGLWNNLHHFEAVVCMKVSTYSETLYQYITQSKLWNFAMITNAGKPGQEVHQSPDILREVVPYFSTVLLKKKGLENDN